MTDMTPSPLRVRKTLRPAAGRQLGPTTVAVAAAMAISPHTRSCDITRIGYDHSASAARGFITGATWPRWVFAAVLVPIAATAYWFLELITDLAGVVFIDLPNGLAPRRAQQHRAPVQHQQPVQVNRAWVRVRRQRAGGLVVLEWHPPLPDPVIVGLASGQLRASSKHDPG